MKKLLAAAIAAGLATLAPAAADAAPAGGTPVVCTMAYHQTKVHRWGGGANVPNASFDGTCVSLTTLEVLPITRGPGYWGPAGGDPACLAAAGLDLLIGGVRYGVVGWHPLGLPPGAPGQQTPQVAAGLVDGSNGATPTTFGLAAFVGTQTCNPGPGGIDRLDGTMVLTMTLPEPPDFG